MSGKFETDGIDTKALLGPLPNGSYGLQVQALNTAGEGPLSEELSLFLSGVGMLLNYSLWIKLKNMKCVKIVVQHNLYIIRIYSRRSCKGSESGAARRGGPAGGRVGERRHGERLSGALPARDRRDAHGARECARRANHSAGGARARSRSARAGARRGWHAGRGGRRAARARAPEPQRTPLRDAPARRPDPPALQHRHRALLEASARLLRPRLLRGAYYTSVLCSSNGTKNFLTYTFNC